MDAHAQGSVSAAGVQAHVIPADLPPHVVPADGLRARKKARTRETISDVATRLFMERGFEAVTLAHVAAAAEVSVKTILNYFGSKEELFFDLEGVLVANLLAAITDRPAGAGLLDGLRTLLADNRIPVPGSGWSALHDPGAYATYRRFVRTEHDSPALRARRLTGLETLRARVAEAIGAQVGRSPTDVEVSLLAGMVVAVLHGRERRLSTAVREGVPAAHVERDVRAYVGAGFDRLRAAFPDLAGLSA